MNRRKKKKEFITQDDAVRVLEIYPQTKKVYDYIKEHPNTDARVIADALGEKQVYIHVNRLEEYKLVTVQNQRERHYYVKHYTINELTTEPTSQTAQKQETATYKKENVQTRKGTMKYDEVKKIFDECLFDDLDNEVSNPDFLFNIGGVDCFSSKSIIAVAGKPGVGKSTAMAILAGVLISGNDFGLIHGKRKATNVLWIDTEKDAFSCKQRMKTLRNVAELDAEKTLREQGIQFLRMKGRSIEERFSLLKSIAEINSQQKIYDAVFIDGIFDLTEDAGRIMNVLPVIELLKDLSESGAAVFAMLHTNKQADDNNMREVLGTELQRICNNRITITCDKDGKHHILHEKSNDTMIAPKVSFVYNEDGTVKNTNEDGSAADKSLPSIPTKQFKEILKNGVLMTHTELKKKLMEATGKADRTVRNWITYASTPDNGILAQDETGKYKLRNES